MMKKDSKTPKQRLSRILSNNLRLIGKVARLTPDYFISVILEGIVWGLINSVEAVFTFHLFDALDAGRTFAEIALIIAAMAVFYLIGKENASKFVYWISGNDFQTERKAGVKDDEEPAMQSVCSHMPDTDDAVRVCGCTECSGQVYICAD